MVEKNTVNAYNPGDEVFSWIAHDYHPHERGTVWISTFCSIIGGIAIWAIFSDPKWGWINASTILFVTAIYFWIHKNGNEDHETKCLERGMLIDEKKYIKWKEFEGFWFVYDETVSVINFEYAGNKGNKITLQIGDKEPDFFRKNLRKIGLKELEEKREAPLDLWIRALKL